MKIKRPDHWGRYLIGVAVVILLAMGLVSWIYLTHKLLVDLSRFAAMNLIKFGVLIG